MAALALFPDASAARITAESAAHPGAGRDARITAESAVRPGEGRDARSDDRRVIGVHLTAWAPGCDNFSSGDSRRWRTFWAEPVEPVMRAILTRLKREPGEIRVEREANGDVGLYAQPRADDREIGELTDPDGFAPFALIHTGVAIEEAEQVLRTLNAAGWSPKLRPIFED